VNYAIDPRTGLPLLQTPGGGGLPLPLSPEEMAAAGAQQVPPWAQHGPEVPPEIQGLPPGAVAGPGAPDANAQFANQLFGTPLPQTPAAQLPSVKVSDAPASIAADDALAPGSLGQVGSGRESQNKIREARAAGQRRPPTAIDPSELATPGQAGGGAAATGQGGMDPTVEQVFKDALSRGRGGGGPAKLRATGQTVKYFQPGAIPDEVSAEAAAARAEREGFEGEMAYRTDARREHLYNVRQAEQQYRAAALNAEQTRRDEQQRTLDEYAAKRDGLIEEAASLKAPEMADYWGSKSTFAQMMTAVSIAIGGALQGLRGGPNPGLEMSNQAIDRWLIGKREEYSRAKDHADAADNQFARMVDTFGSENLATANMREQAYAARDAMLLDYADVMGTPSAKEAAQALLLSQQEQRAQGKAQAYAAAGREIEEKLSLSGGGGGRSPRLLKALGEAAQAQEYLNKINGVSGAPTREVQNEKVEAVTGALDALTAAGNVKRHLTKMGYAESDSDDPTTGWFDRAANSVPGSDTKRTVQDLEQDTFNLARGAQLSLGKSDNDARLAEQWASGGGGSGRERVRAADNIAKKSLGRIQDTLSSLTPAQRAAFVKSLPPERRAQLQEALGSVARPSAAASEQAVTVE
jgi:hypothetical protein